jgi:hypothetical protein
MTARPSEIRTYHDIQAQADLERMLARRRAAEAARAERFAKPDPANLCDDTDSPLPAMLLWAALSLLAWGLFGWAVVSVVRALMRAAA